MFLDALFAGDSSGVAILAILNLTLSTLSGPGLHGEADLAFCAATSGLRALGTAPLLTGLTGILVFGGQKTYVVPWSIRFIIIMMII